MPRTVLITGTSTGIGRETAKLFHEKGWNVVATMRNPSAEHDLGERARVLVARLDVTESGSIESAIAAGIDHFGGIDVLVNNAGYGAFGPLESTPREKMARQFDTNVIGLLETSKAILPHFRERRSGVIVNVSSMGGLTGGPLGTLYHATKFAVEGISESLCFEMAPIGVRVKVVEPGLVATDFNSRSIDVSNDPPIEAYQGVVRALVSGSTDSEGYRSGPELPASVIYEAATDGTDRLRYPSGEDAHEVTASIAAKGAEAHLKERVGRFARVSAR